MENPKGSTRALYWLFTVLFAFPLSASGIAFLIKPAAVVQSMAHLGYPAYFLTILGVAKVLGALAVLIGIFPRMKEWAYAGFTFDLIGAAWSHLASGDGSKAAGPLVVLVFMGMSYRYWKKITAIRENRS